MTDIALLTKECPVLRGPKRGDFGAYGAFLASGAARILAGPSDMAAAWREFAADARAALPWAATVLGPTQILGHINTANRASIALAEKLAATRAPEPAPEGRDCAVSIHDLESFRS